MFDEYQTFAYDQAREAARLKRSKEMLKQLGDFAESYRQQWLPRLPGDELQAILTGRAMPWLPDDVQTERDLCALRNLWLRTEAVLRVAQAIRPANKGRKSVQNEWLYHRLCGMWLDHFGGGDLRYGRPGSREPSGPLIQFMLTTIMLVVPRHSMPSREALRDAIDRERKERDNVQQAMFRRGGSTLEK